MLLIEEYVASEVKRKIESGEIREQIEREIKRSLENNTSRFIENHVRLKFEELSVSEVDFIKEKIRMALHEIMEDKDGQLKKAIAEEFMKIIVGKLTNSW